MYSVVAILSLAGYAFAQSSSPQELSREALEAQRAGRYDEAIRDYRLLVARYPDVFELRSNLGAALAGQGLYPEAIAEYGRALALRSNPQVRLNLALAYFKTGDFNHAAETLKQVHAEAPDNLQATTLLADCELKLGSNKEVVELLMPVQRVDPDNPALIYLLGTALVRDGQTARGQVLIDEISRKGDTAESRLLMGTVKYLVGDFGGAREDFEKAIASNPNLPEASAYYGMALLSTGDKSGARKAFEHELQIDPNNFVANLQMGELLRQDEDNEGAIKYLRQAAAIRPSDQGVRFQIASVELAQERLEDAQRDLESLVKDAPQFIEAHAALATVYFREKRKPDGDRERAIYARLNEARQAKSETAAKPAQ